MWAIPVGVWAPRSTSRASLGRDGGPLPLSALIPALLLPSCPGAVFSIPRDFWGLLAILADAFWASLLASVSSMGRGADGNVECDGAQSPGQEAWFGMGTLPQGRD